MSAAIIQAIGFAGLLFAVLSFQNKQRKNILLCQIIGSIFYIFHFLLLGAITGSIMNLIGAVRSYVFYNREKKWASKLIWLYIFLFLVIIGALFTWKNNFSILPMIAMCVSTVSFWMKNPKYIRLIMLLSPPCWLTYNIVSGSIPGVMTEIFVFISLITGIIRFDIIKPSDKSINESIF
ncbi:MAG: YgjV family protein [Ignavibacteriales bacterium]